jgi:hypothetical protein
MNIHLVSNFMRNKKYFNNIIFFSLFAGIIFASLNIQTAEAFIFGSENKVAQWIKNASTIILRTETNDVRIGSGDGALFVDTSSSKVGIGTSTPGFTLDIYGDLRVNTNSTLGTIISGIWNGATIDIGSYTNLTVGAVGIELSNDDIALTAGYEIPLTASTTEWVTAYTHSQDNSQAHSDYLLNTGDTATGDYNFDSNTLFIDSTNNRLGLGTTSPASHLHISGVDPEIRLTDTGDSEYTRITRSDTNKKAQRFNRVTKPGSVYSISNLVAQWKMNDNAANTTVSELGGTYNGVATVNTNTISVAGKIDTALSFNGNGDVVTITDPNIGAVNNYTICFWYYPSETPSYRRPIVSYGDDAANRGWMIYHHSNGTIGFINAIFSNVQTATSIPVNSWSFICARRLTSGWFNMDIYLNGVWSNGVAANDAAAPSATDDFLIGKKWANDTLGWPMWAYGRTDDVRYYNKALSATEISKIYNNGSGTDEQGLNAASTVEVNVWNSQDGSLSDEEGIQTFGASVGRTIIDGKTLRFNIAGSEVANINASGLAMIGSSAEAAELLEIENGLSTTGLQISNTATDGDPILAFALSGTKTFTMGVDDGDSDKFKIGTTAIGTNTRLTIDSAGLVGVGTDAPAELLEIANGLSTTILQISNTATDGDPALAFALSGTKTFTMGVDDGDSDKFKIGTTAIGTNTRLTIDSAGKVTVAGDLQANNYFSGDGSQGITNSSSYWMCTASDCSTTCQVTIKDGLITSCI